MQLLGDDSVLFIKLGGGLYCRPFNLIHILNMFLCVYLVDNKAY